jgi:ribokinase
MGKLLVVGSINMDLVVRVERIPREGETIPGGNLTFIPGGKGANQAVAGALAGAEVSMIGRVGDDDNGRKLLNNLKTNGVKTGGIRIDDSVSSGLALISVDCNGQNSIIVVAGANGMVAGEDLKENEDLFHESDILLLQHEIPQEAIEVAVLMANVHGTKVILNPAPYRMVPKKLLGMTDYLIPNETECAELTGYNVDSEEGMNKAADYLLNLGVDNLLITLGKRGVFIVTKTSRQLIPAFSVKAVDTTAAGDTFIGSFAARLLAGGQLHEAARYGCAAAALSVQRFGAQTSMPYKQEIEAFLDKAARN